VSAQRRIGLSVVIGYCTNVHAGATLAETRRQLDEHATAVRVMAAPDRLLDIGLWLSASAARELCARPSEIQRFADWLAQRGLRVFTLNGFPHGDFHGARVKHRVYRPSWDEPERARYTLDLAHVLVGVIGERMEAGISTLPVGWPGPPCPAVDLDRATSALRETARALDRLARDTGKVIHLDLEPEPGCILSTSADAVRFFQESLWRGQSPAELEVLRRHVRICHDICHAAVMFENQREALARYRAAGLAIGKVQVSSALRVNLSRGVSGERDKTLAALRQFADDRYLHQTVMRDGQRLHFFEDLPEALAALGHPDRAADECRVHYHLPITAATAGPFATTQQDITECLGDLQEGDGVRDLEIETYTWTLLPAGLRPVNLAAGIAREIQWLEQQPAINVGC